MRWNRRLGTAAVALGVALGGLTATAAPASADSSCKTAFGQDVPSFLCHKFSYQQPGPPTASDAVALCIMLFLADPPAGATSVLVQASGCTVSVLNPNGLDHTDSLTFCLMQFLADPWVTRGAIGVNGISCAVDIIGG